MTKFFSLILLMTFSIASYSAPAEEKKEPSKIAEKSKTESKSTGEAKSLGKNWMFGFGPAWYRDLDTTHAKSVLLGYSWEVAPNLDLQGKYEFSYANSNDLETRTDLVLIGASYSLLDSKHSPYVSGDFGFGTFRNTDDPIYGWSIGGAIGYRFFCSSHISFSVELKASAFDSKIDANRPSLTTIRAILFF